MNLRDVGLWIATPNYNGWLGANYTVSMLATQVWAAKSGLRAFNPQIDPGDSLVTRVRNVMLEKFRQSDRKFTHYLQIDSDIGWHPKSVERLLMADRDVICGAYPKKCDAPDWPINFWEDVEIEVTEGVAPILELKDAPTGFLLVKREVIDRMVEAYPERHCSFGPDTEGYLLFDAYIDSKSGRYLSEDYGFCRLWQALGGKVWLEPNVPLTHFGAKLYDHGSIVHDWEAKFATRAAA